MDWPQSGRSLKPGGGDVLPDAGLRWPRAKQAEVQGVTGGGRSSDGDVRSEVRASLVGTLYGSRSSLAIGAVGTSGVSVLVATQAGDRWLTVCATCICLLATGRIIASHLYKHLKPSAHSPKSSRWEQCFALCAWCYSMLLGLLGALTLVRSADGGLHLLAVTTAVGYAAGIAARNAGRPLIALGQLGLALFPITLVLLFSHSPTAWAMAGTIIVLSIAMMDITMKTHNVILQAMTSAREQAGFAESQARLARQDSLTGLANRMAFIEQLEASLSASNGDSCLAVHSFDLDHFKEVNDTYGHMAGNALLAEIGRRLTAEFTDTNSIAARVGGDEFAILTRLGEQANAGAIGSHILDLVARPFYFGGISLAVTASVGGALAVNGGLTSDALLARADLALYRAKANRGGECCFYQPATDELVQRQRVLEKELRFALNRGEFELFYQPIVDLVTNEIISCEALLRWNSRSLGSVSPAEFVPIAEQSNLMGTIGEWVLREACHEANWWPSHIRVAVNVSAVQLRNHRFPALVRSALQASTLPAGRLEIEVTETMLLEDDQDTLEVLRAINELGVRTTLDDFGTGFSTLSYLTKFPFQTLKIDGCFVGDLDQGAASMAIIQTVVELAATLGLDTVAECIETQAQLGQVTRARCSAGQGHLFSRPMPARDLRVALVNARQVATSPALIRGSKLTSAEKTVLRTDQPTHQLEVGGCQS